MSMSNPPEWVNAKQAAGEHRIIHAALFDEEVRPYNERFRAAARVRPGDRVLDIGCGTGQSTREAARAAVGGSVLGVDLSAQAVELARRLSEQEGLRNVTFRQADAQVHRFPPRHFDLCISRFGTMFFADPVAAFANTGTALRPGGRLVILVWQAATATNGPPRSAKPSATRTPFAHSKRLAPVWRLNLPGRVGTIVGLALVPIEGTGQAVSVRDGRDVSSCSRRQIARRSPPVGRGLRNRIVPGRPT